jgi:phage terminase small subunit
VTEQRKAFCDEYLRCFNATAAAIKAGYSEKTARIQASQILAEDEISLYIEDRLREVSKEAEIDSIWITKRFKNISDRCMTVIPVLIHNGEKWVESGEYKFDSAGANKATEMLGKIFGVFEKDNEQQRPKNEIDISKLSTDAINDILNATK